MIASIQIGQHQAPPINEWPRGDLALDEGECVAEIAMIARQSLDLGVTKNHRLAGRCVGDRMLFPSCSKDGMRILPVARILEIDDGRFSSRRVCFQGFCGHVMYPRSFSSAV